MWRWHVNAAFIVTLAALLLAPLVQMIRPFVKAQRIDERRQLHAVDRFLPRLMRLDVTLADDVSNWFNDHYGFRDILIRAKNELDYQLFRVSDKVLVGDDGWLFEDEFYEALRKNDMRDAEPIVQEVRDFSSCLMKRGMTLVIVYNVSKGTIYPEHLPKFKARVPRNGLAQRVSAALEHDRDVIFIDGERILRPHKRETLFFRTDVHMNGWAARLVYTELVARMAESLGMAPPKPPDLERYVGPWFVSGSEERFMSKFLPIGEIIDVPKETGRRFKDNADGRWIINTRSGNEDGESSSPFDYVFINLRKNVPLLPTTVVLGTSSIDYFFALGFNESFQAVYRTINNTTERNLPAVENLPAETKFVIFEYPEPLIVGLDILPAATKICNASLAALLDSKRRLR